MAPSTSVPSKAVLNTLRGLLFTTSCSVLILTEERRRRIKIARAIVDNARKLHTVKSNQGAVALAGGLANWELQLADWNDDAVRIPRPPGERRLRRAIRSSEPRKDAETDNQIQHPWGQPLEPKKITKRTESPHSTETRAREFQAQILSAREAPSLYAAAEHRVFTQIPPIKNSPSDLALQLDRENGSEVVAASELESESRALKDKVEVAVQSDSLSPQSLVERKQATRFSVAEALTTREDSDIPVATRRMHEVDLASSKPKRIDFSDRRKAIRKDAAAGRWDSVERGIRKLASALGRHYAVPEHQTFQVLLHKLVAVFAEDNPGGELDKLIRRWDARYGMKAKPRCAQLVLDHYSKLGARARKMSWMEYCDSRGIPVNDYWSQRTGLESFNYRDSLRSDNGASPRGTSLQSDDDASTRASSLQSDDSASTQASSLQSDEDVSAQPSCLKSDGYPSTGTKHNADESMGSAVDVLELMSSLAYKEDWNSVCDVFAQIFPTGYGESQKCLQLAVTAHLKRPGGGIEPATGILQEAHALGHDVSEPMRLLMLAHLRTGCDAFGLVHYTLSMGVSVHDSVYNLAAHTMASKGNQRGSIKMCELAAKENGNGKLAYNAFNFANLVVAYTGLERYKALDRLLSDFTSVTEKWYLAKPCKESIKFATKLVAARSVAAGDDCQAYTKTLDRLGRALVHIKIGRRTEKGKDLHLRSGSRFWGGSSRSLAGLPEAPYGNSGILGAGVEERAGMRSGQDARAASQAHNDNSDRRNAAAEKQAGVRSSEDTRGASEPEDVRRYEYMMG